MWSPLIDDILRRRFSPIHPREMAKNSYSNSQFFRLVHSRRYWLQSIYCVNSEDHRPHVSALLRRICAGLGIGKCLRGAARFTFISGFVAVGGSGLIIYDAPGRPTRAKQECNSSNRDRLGTPFGSARNQDFVAGVGQRTRGGTCKDGAWEARTKGLMNGLDFSRDGRRTPRIRLLTARAPRQGYSRRHTRPRILLYYKLYGDPSPPCVSAT